MKTAGEIGGAGSRDKVTVRVMAFRELNDRGSQPGFLDGLDEPVCGGLSSPVGIAIEGDENFPPGLIAQLAKLLWR